MRSARQREEYGYLLPQLLRLGAGSRRRWHRYLAPFSTASRIRMVNAASEVPDLIFDVGHTAAHQADHFHHHQVADGNLQQEDVHAPLDELGTLQTAGLVHVELFKELRHTGHGGFVQNVCGNLCALLAFSCFNLCSLKLATLVRIQALEERLKLWDHFPKFAVAQLHIFLFFLAGVVQGALDQDSRHEVHQSDGHNDDQGDKVRTEFGFLLDQRNIDGGNGIHGDELGKRHHDDKKATEILLNDPAGHHIGLQGVVFGDHLNTEDGEDIEHQA
mmetsp:Transcript_6727/g.15276  ORF Transcript_6727/g.15276 Transcript_6727/m.15276 type:complete len:274 (-) Transcript_6727:979-1800(-)